jgi:2,5-diketo-D-gluconate reductase B
VDQPTIEAQGASVPKIGFGTWQITGEACFEAVRDALALGYRHLDTAAVYDNEREVGMALAESGVDRGEVWLTSKVWMDDLSRNRLRASAENSLRDLRAGYLDLLLIHWPSPRFPIGESLAEMMRLRDEGKVRHLGVSNFTPRLLREALEQAPLLCNQVEYHVHLDQERLLAIADQHDMVLGAYAPFSHGEVLSEPVLGEIAEAHRKSPGQVALRWLIEQERVVALPKAASHANRAANLDVFDFELSAEERSRLDALPKDRRRFDTSWAPDWED